MTVVPVSPLGSQSIQVVSPFARVVWGTRGFLGTADVDIGTGCQFTVSASQIRVEVGLDNIGIAGGTMNLSGMLSFRSIMRTSPLTRTLVQAVTTDDIYPIPPFSKRVWVYREGALPLVAVTINLLDSSQSPIATYVMQAMSATVPAVGSFMFDPITLPNQAYFVELVYAVGPSSLRCVFDLDI